MADVFLSYKREDATRVGNLVAALRKTGLAVWWDEDIPPSAPWEATIEKALRAAKAVIVCWSPASVSSENVRSEARVARDDGRLIQVFVEPCTPPLFFGERQGVDLTRWRGNADDPRIARIVECVREVAGGKPVVAGARPKERWFGLQALTRRHIFGIIIGVLVLLGAGGLIAWRVAIVRPSPQIAVLPFEDLSPTHDKAYFAEGVAEEILSTLAAEKGIKVLGRSSARQIERNTDPKTIRASLGVTHLLEGSARSAGDQLRMNVRLIDTSDNSLLWEEEYQGKLANVFAVQDQIAAAVVKRLRGTLFESAVKEAPVTSIDAYQSYLAARALMREPKKDTLTQAWRIARQIVDSHPDYAPGHALLAATTWLLADDPYSYGTIPVDKARRIATYHAREAIRLAPDQADGYSALALALKPPESLAPLRKAIALDPSRSSLRGNLGIDLNILGRHAEAFEQYRLSMETDPLASALVNRYVASLAASGRGDEAFREIDTYVRRGGDKAQAWRFRGFANILLGNESEAIAARLRGLALDPQLPYQAEWLAMQFNLLGFDEQEARYRADLSPYLQLFLADNRGALRSRTLQDGAKAWSANKFEYAIFSLARARDWLAIIQTYDARPQDSRDLCVRTPNFAPFIAMALERQGRAAESAHILGCVQRNLTQQLATPYRSPDDAPGEPELWQASLFAMRGDGRAFDWLSKAVTRGWLGQYYSGSLSDWPQFDKLRGDPRYTEIQRRMDARIAKERAEVLTLRGQLPPQT
jgi:TolB-like protein